MTASNYQPFPQVLIELQQEVLAYHPQLAAHPEATSDPAHNLGLMAGWVGIEVDGMFDDAEICLLAEKILARLRAMRTNTVH